MDRETEQFVPNLLSKLKPDLAILFITHRLHLLKKRCDEIYLLENRTTNCHGKHDELIKTENLYKKYWDEMAV
jgi:ATP-binding cassette subfamily B protein